MPIDYEDGSRMVLEVEPFRAWVNMLPGHLGEDLEAVVMCQDMHTLITDAFLAGHLTDVVTFGTDSKGKIQMRLAGIPIMFTDKLTLGRNLLVVKGHLGRPGDNPVCPTTGGGPDGPEGGTPVPVAKAA